MTTNDEHTGNVYPMFGTTKVHHYKMKNDSAISLNVSSRDRDRVVISSESDPKLFIDNVWPGSIVLSDYLCSRPDLCNGKLVVELGAGTALPSLVAATLGARKVVITDYPDRTVLDNISHLVYQNELSHSQVCVLAHEWGSSVETLLDEISDTSGNKFQLILVAEPLWKDTYPLHDALLRSIAALLCRSEGQALVSFAHRPTENHCAANDLEFFSLGRERYGLQSTYLGCDASHADALDDETEDGYIEVHSYAMHFC